MGPFVQRIRSMIWISKHPTTQEKRWRVEMIWLSCTNPFVKVLIQKLFFIHFFITAYIWPLCSWLYFLFRIFRTRDKTSRILFLSCKENCNVVFTILTRWGSIADYPIISIEDPFEQDDWEHTKKLTDLKICQVVAFFHLFILLLRMINFVTWIVYQSDGMYELPLLSCALSHPLKGPKAPTGLHFSAF